MDAFRIVLTVVVLIGVVAAILFFERRRADRITRDTQDMARGRSPRQDGEEQEQ